MILSFFYKYFKSSNNDIINILIKNNIGSEKSEILKNIYTWINIKINLK
jgi:hypothetical protein